MIVAFGDSTTAPREHLTTYSDLLEKELPEKGLLVRIINAGVPNSTTSDAQKRLQKDLLFYKPDIVIMQFGINDSWVYIPKNESKVQVTEGEFRDNLKDMAHKIKSQGAKVLLMTPNPLRWTDFFAKQYGSTSVRLTPFDLADPRGFNFYLDQYVPIVRQVAAEDDLVLVDVHQAFEGYGKVKGQRVADLLVAGVHPNNKGHRIIADLLAIKIVEVCRRDLK